VSSTTGMRSRTLQPSEMSAPCLVFDVDVVDGLPALPAPKLGGARCAWVLVHFRTEPLGAVIVEIPRRGLDSEELARIVWEEFGPAIEDRARPGHVSLAPDGSLIVPQPDRSTFAESRESVLRQAPEITVIVCTRERPEELERCLNSLVRQAYPRFSILVVDNAPVSDCSRQVASRFDQERVKYIVEPTPGLSWARNRGLTLATADVIAWIDDDEIADTNWPWRR